MESSPPGSAEQALPSPPAPPGSGFLADWYHALFQGMDQGFCVLELLFDTAGQQVVDFIYRQLNPAFSQQSGIPEGALGKTSREVMPDLEPFWFNTYSRVFHTGESARLEHHVPQVGRWFDVHAFRLGPPEARQIAVLSQDISARKRQEANLAFLSEVSQDLVELTSIGDTMRALGAKLGAHFHASACVFTDVDQAAGLFVAEHVWHRADVPSLQGVYRYANFHTEEFRQASRAGETFVVRDGAADPRVNGANMAAIRVGAYVNVPFVRHGEWLFSLALYDTQPRDWRPDEIELLRELTDRIWTRLERARAEEALAASEEKYRSLFTSIDEGFCTVEVLFDALGQVTDYRFLEANLAFVRQTGLENAVGRTMRELAPAHEAFWFDTYGRVARTGEPVRFEHAAAALGKFYDVYAFRIGAPAANRVAILFTDIAARKQQEQQQAFLLRFSDALRAETSATSVAYRALGLLSEQLRLDRCYIGLYDLAEDRGIFPHQVGNDRVPPLPAAVRLSDFPDALRVAYDRTLRIDDLAHTAGLSDTDRHNLGSLGLRALVAATLRRGGDGPQWAIVALSADVRHWTPGEVALLEEATERTWAAMERARAEEALRASEQRQRALIANLPGAAVFVVDRDLRYQLAEGEALRQVGYDPADYLGRSVQETAPSGQWPTYRAMYEGALAGRGFEQEHTQGGRTFLTRGVPLPGPTGEVASVLAVSYDLTARKQAEEALQASQATLAAVFEALPVGVGVFDAAGKLTIANPQMQQYLPTGRMPSRDDRQHARWRAFHPDGRPLARPEFPGARALRGEKVVPGVEMLHTPAEGPDAWTQVISVPLPDGRGRVSGQVTVILDIDARKRAEEALRVSEAKYRTLFETMDQGFGVAELLPGAGPGGKVDFRWLELNPQVERLTGMPQAALLSGETLRNVMPQLEDILYEQYEQVARTGEPARFEQHAQVLGRWFDVYVYALDGPGSRRIGLLFTNITARKQAEEALRQAEESHRQELEQRVAQRTQELQESRDLLHGIAASQAAIMTAFTAIRDETGHIVDLKFIFVNVAGEERANGYPLVGERYLTMYPEAEKTGFLDMFRRVIETGAAEEQELAYDDGKLTGWFRTSATRLGDGVLAITEDITARKQAEQERLRTLRLLEQAEAVAGLGSWDYNLLSQELLWSDGMYQLFGLPVGQPVRPDVYLQFVVDDDRALAEDLVRRVQTGDGTFEETLRLRVGGQVKTMRIKAVVLTDESGKPVRVLGVDLDISQLQRLEADNLRLRLTQQRALFEAVQAAQEAERRHIAEGLHNGVGQLLYATKLRLDQLHTPVLRTDPALVAARQEADRLLAEAIRQTRALSHELVPLVLEEFGLAAALQDVGRQMSTPQLRFRCQAQLDDEAGPLAPPLQLALYRMAQELAHNIVKHARGATEASLEVETTPGWVLLRAQDNGPGFAGDAAAAAGLGLRSIRDRVELLGGALETGTANGAYVRLRLPLTPPA